MQVLVQPPEKRRGGRQRQRERQRENRERILEQTVMQSRAEAETEQTWSAELQGSGPLCADRCRSFFPFRFC